VNQGVEESQILLLVRSSADKWRQQLQPAFENVGLTLSSADWVRDALQDKKLRAIIALSRLHGNKEDSIAWWSITVALTNGVGHMFTDYVYKECQNGETWAHTLLRLHELGFPELSVTLANKVTDTINDSQKRLASLGSELEIWLAENPNSPWSDWLIAEAESSDWDNKSVGTQLSEAAVRLLSLVGSVQEAATSLNSFLNQLEKVGSDLALESGGIRLMSISQSKGLTVDTAIILGLEEGLIPLRRPSVDPDEERRLLYVALTRAKKVCIATMASRRFGSLARSGGGTAYQLRERSDLVSALSFGSPIRPDSLLEKLKEFGSQ
jgi:superfamily I DNA/RNA helicase